MHTYTHTRTHKLTDTQTQTKTHARTHTHTHTHTHQGFVKGDEVHAPLDRLGVRQILERDLDRAHGIRRFSRTVIILKNHADFTLSRNPPSPHSIIYIVYWNSIILVRLYHPQQYHWFPGTGIILNPSRPARCYLHVLRSSNDSSPSCVVLLQHFLGFAG
jgi:hypothetical protein